MNNEEETPVLFPAYGLETETEHNLAYTTDATVSPSIVVPKEQKKKGLKISGQRNKPKRPFSQVLEILLLKASLKIKVSDRNLHQLSLKSKNETLRRMYRRLQISDDNKTRTGKGIEEANVSQTEISSSVLSSSSYDPKNTRSSTVGKSLSRPRAKPFDHKETSAFPENHIITKPCSCNNNPGLHLFVFTLFITVVWGRARAILFTLVFLYLFPMWAGFRR